MSNDIAAVTSERLDLHKYAITWANVLECERGDIPAGPKEKIS